MSTAGPENRPVAPAEPGNVVTVTRELQPCGTPGAYQRHRKRGEPPCQPCKDANAAAHRDYMDRHPEQRARHRKQQNVRYHRQRDEFGLPKRQPMRHGTPWARSLHYAAGEPLCLDCAWSIADSHRTPDCGTEAGASRHRRHGETCETCRVDGRVGRTVSQPHGSESAVRRHEYNREPCCELCLPVQRQKSRAKRARQKARRAAEQDAA